MRRFFIGGRLSDTMEIRGQDARHIGKVLRLEPGDELLVVDEAGQAGRAVIQSALPGVVTVGLRQLIAASTEPPVRVWLAQGLPKSDKMELVVQKAVELGAAGIMPMVTDFCTVQYDAAKKASRVSRWQKIAQEAAKQCGRNTVPEISPVRSLAEVLDGAGEAAVFMLYEGEMTHSLKQALRERAAGSYLLLVGPEGGFSAAEAELCRKRGARPVSLGPRILRTETAALAGLAMVLYEHGDLG
ncbi:MAG TPA: 16S rRNA (uracil(1498)-N(3))-methyltransferase [Selenomonadales bacterium]|nr:16S rRNA (uracil(1498)-N(3))-methyltransferase [Selenomonadales bacterium]